MPGAPSISARRTAVRSSRPIRTDIRTRPGLARKRPPLTPIDGRRPLRPGARPTGSHRPVRPRRAADDPGGDLQVAATRPGWASARRTRAGPGLRDRDTGDPGQAEPAG